MSDPIKLQLGEHGSVQHHIDINEDYALTEDIYPLCGMVVQTAVGHRGTVMIIQPNTYTQRVTIE